MEQLSRRSSHVERFWALEGATLSVNSSVLIAGQPHDPHPCPAYLIEHKRGLVLWDTGVHPDASEDPVGVYGQKLVDFVGLAYQPHQRIDRQLQALGVKPSDVKFVIISHLHFDHAGGLHLFPDAKVLLGKGEIAYALWPSPTHGFLYRQDDIRSVAYDNAFEVSADLDLFGDGSIVILNTPGHTPGQLSLLVRLRDRSFILAGDTIHTREALVSLEPLSLDVDKREAVDSLRRLRLLVAQHDASLWIPHDPRDWAQYGGAGCYE